jgi:hypothetical protein
MHTEIDPDIEAAVFADVDASIAACEASVMASLPALDELTKVLNCPSPSPQELPPATCTGPGHITIRIPTPVINAYRQRAKSTGTRYQTLMNNVLREAIVRW